MVDEDHVVDGLGQFGEQVAGHEHGAALAGQAAQQAAQPVDALGVEPVGGLVQDQGLRVAEQRGGQCEPLPHALGVAAGPAVRGAAEPDQLEHLLDPLAADPRGACGDPQRGPPGPPGMEHVRAGQRADVPQRVAQVPVRAPVDGGPAAGRHGQAEQQPDGGRFPGSVRAEEPGDAARCQLEGQVADRGDGAVPLGQRLDGDGTHGSSP